MSSSLAPSLKAQQQVLEVDIDLLREVLACLGTDVAECHAALLVSCFWRMALERYVCMCLDGVCVGCGYWVWVLRACVLPSLRVLIYLVSSPPNQP